MKKKEKKRTVHSIIVIDPNEQTDRHTHTDYTISAKVSSLWRTDWYITSTCSNFSVHFERLYLKCRQNMAVGKMSRGMKFCRLVLTLLNVSFIILGLILLVLGFLIVHNPVIQQLRPLLNPDVTWKYAQFFSTVEIFSIVLIIIGGLLFTLGFIGRWSTLKTCHACSTLPWFRLLWNDEWLSIFASVLRGYPLRHDSCWDRLDYRLYCLPVSFSSETNQPSARFHRYLLYGRAREWLHLVQFLVPSLGLRPV